ncbi:hypothetical protein FHS42_003930 [Streptomyces zagrosensis]|uniref:HD domain-containing protein n=2 Tax=Streptomyces zagrosensis TaxID=1042984 RepID=A0A7W9QBR9_9ACTN|nr:hypothetical protein [Streptomyces zagrosensis]
MADAAAPKGAGHDGLPPGVASDAAAGADEPGEWDGRSRRQQRRARRRLLRPGGWGSCPRPGGTLAVAVTYGVAGALAVASCGWTAWQGLSAPRMALAFGALIAAGEAIRCREAAPATATPRAATPEAGAPQAVEQGTATPGTCSLLDAPGSRGTSEQDPLAGLLGPGDWTAPMARADSTRRPLAADGGPKAGEYAVLGREREPTPLAAAGALAYVLLGMVAGERGAFGVAQTVAIVLAASLVGLVVPVALGQRPGVDRLVRRVLTVGFAVTCCQPLYHSGPLAPWHIEGPHRVPYLLALLLLTALYDALLTATFAWARTNGSYAPLLRDQLRALLGMGVVVCATGVVMALAVDAAGLWTLPVFGVPLLLAQGALRRGAAVRATYRQTVASLACATEIAGYTPPGHARRVALLSQQVGRELDLSERALSVLECAALMHDIGQLSLVDPVPAGATEPLPAPEARRIALLGGAVVRQTGVPAEVAVVVEQQAAPYREQPLTARIVRVVNAYVDLTGDLGAQSAAAPCDAAPLPSTRGVHTAPSGGEGAQEPVDRDGGAGWGTDWNTDWDTGGGAGWNAGGGSAAGADSGRPGGMLWAMRRLQRGTVREYDPAVVAALARVLQRAPRD